jgi:hypothetical protein
MKIQANSTEKGVSNPRFGYAPSASAGFMTTG